MVESVRYNGAGIYVLTNTTNGKKYIGSTRHVRERMVLHNSTMEHMRCNNKLKPDVKAGHFFSVDILEKLPNDITDEQLIEKEKAYIKQYDTCKNGYNIVFTCDKSTTRQMRWEKENVDRVSLNVRKDYRFNKAVLQKAADACGISLARLLLEGAGRYIIDELGLDWYNENKNKPSEGEKDGKA